MVKRSDLPMVSCWMDLSLTEECGEAGDGGGLDGNGGFGHHTVSELNPPAKL